jgi:hypothetical protein
MARDSDRDADQTVKRTIDVAKAFGDVGEERPTKPAVHVQVPLDAVPMLAVPRDEIPWDSLGQKTSQVMLRVDGTTCVMVISTDTGLPPADVASELASLVTHGFVHLVAPPSSDADLDLELATG